MVSIVCQWSGNSAPYYPYCYKLNIIIKWLCWCCGYSINACNHTVTGPHALHTLPKLGTRTSRCFIRFPNYRRNNQVVWLVSPICRFCVISLENLKKMVCIYIEIEEILYCQFVMSQWILVTIHVPFLKIRICTYWPQCMHSNQMHVGLRYNMVVNLCYTR